MDVEKRADFIADQALSCLPVVTVALDKALPAFYGDKGTDPALLRAFLLSIAKHESDGGRQPVQIGGGPARGAWQIEPWVAMDIVRSSGLIGKKALEVLGVTRRWLLNLREHQWSKHLEYWHTLSAVIAIAKVLQAADHYGRLDDLS